MALPEPAAEAKQQKGPQAITEEYFTLIGDGRFDEGLRFFAPACRTRHSPNET